MKNILFYSKLVQLVILLFPISLFSENQNLLFDGEDDYVEFNYINDYDLNHQDFTFELNLTANTQQLPYPTFISTEGYSFGLDDSGLPRLVIETTEIIEYNAFDLRDKVCHHLAVTNKSGLITFYIDGQKISSYSSMMISAAQSNLYLGLNINDISHTAFNGSLDNVRIWNIARTDSEIDYYKDECYSDFSNQNIIFNAQIEEYSGEFVHDYSYFKNHGKLGSVYFSDINNPIFQTNNCYIDVCCKANSNFSATYLNAVPNYNIEFTNTSTNAVSFQWYIDGVLASNSINFNHSFSNIGEYTITLKSFNGNYNCIDYFSERIEIVAPNELDFCGSFPENDQAIEECECFNEYDYYKANYNWIDRFGNKYCNIDILPEVDCLKNTSEFQLKSGPTIPVAYSSPDCTAGIFDLYFEDIQESNTGYNFNSTALQNHKEIICQVFSDISVLLVSSSLENVKIKIQSFNDISSGTIASAGSYYDISSSVGFSNGEVWDAINGVNNPNEWDGRLRVNMAKMNVCYAGMDPSLIGPFEYDFYSTILHEAMHLLGVSSFTTATGSSLFSNVYSNYDRFLEVSGSAIINSGSFVGNPASDLHNGCSHLEFKGTNTAFGPGPVHSPSAWSGSSISHFNNACPSNDFVLHPFAIQAQYEALTEIEKNVLCDLGYTVGSNYGTPNIITSPTTPNPRIQTLTPCGFTLVAIDDTEQGCSPAIPFDVDACLGSQLLLDPVDIMCNDLWTNSLNNVHISNIFDTELNQNLPLSGTSYVFTPSQYGPNVLVYTLEDDDGNVSNEATIQINVGICMNSLSSNCTYTNTCNQICNPSFEYTCTNQQKPANSNILSLVSSPYNNCNEKFFLVNGWLPLSKSPDLIIDPSTNNSHGFSSPNFISLPYDSNTSLIRGGSFPGIADETIGTSVNIETGKNYILSYHSPGITHPTVSGVSGIDVYLDNFSNFTFNAPDGFQGGLIGSNMNLSTSLNLISDTNAGHLGWTRSIHKFSANSDYDLIYFRSINNGIQNSFGLDLVDLMEDNLNSDFINVNEIAYSCATTLTIGAELCNITNIRYNWYDVSSGTPIKLTQGTTNLNVDPNISIPVGSNGSQLEVEVYSDKVYRLEREFFESDSVPIVTANTDSLPVNDAINSARDFLDINVKLNLGLELSKTEISGNNFPGGVLTYEILLENQSGSALSNFTLIDKLSVGDFDLNSLDFTNIDTSITASIIGDSIVFIIDSLADGDLVSFQYNVSIDSSILGGNLVENCIAYSLSSCIYEVCVETEICEPNLNFSDFTYTIDPICGQVNFSATNAAAWYQWDFDGDGVIDLEGEGSNSIYSNPSYIYTANATYNASLIAYPINNPYQDEFIDFLQNDVFPLAPKVALATDVSSYSSLVTSSNNCTSDQYNYAVNNNLSIIRNEPIVGQSYSPLVTYRPYLYFFYKGFPAIQNFKNLNLGSGTNGACSNFTGNDISKKLIVINMVDGFMVDHGFYFESGSTALACGYNFVYDAMTIDPYSIQSIDEYYYDNTVDKNIAHTVTIMCQGESLNVMYPNYTGITTGMYYKTGIKTLVTFIDGTSKLIELFDTRRNHVIQPCRVYVGDACSNISIKTNTFSVTCITPKRGEDENLVLGHHKDINVYPNPSSGIVNLEFDSDKKKEIIVRNSLGQQIISTAIYDKNFRFDLSLYSKGLYQIYIKLDEQTFYKKILHQ